MKKFSLLCKKLLYTSGKDSRRRYPVVTLPDTFKEESVDRKHSRSSCYMIEYLNYPKNSDIDGSKERE